MRSQGLYWGLVDDLTVDAVSTRLAVSYGPSPRRATSDYRLPIRAKVPGRWTSGFYWVIASLGAHGDTGFRVVDAYAHPAYSRSLMLPVDSIAERRTAVILLEELAGSEHRTELTLREPLGTFDLPDRLIAPPPDFLIEQRTSGAKIAIEAMGALDDISYTHRKHRTHALMRRIPGVTEIVEHDVGGTGDTQFRRQLRSAIAHLTAPTTHPDEPHADAR